MIVTIHQPEYLPWLGLFDKVRQCDLFVLLDNVPFSKHYFQNRNRVRSQQGTVWLTIPVRTTGKFGQLISQVTIDSTNPWRRKNLNTIIQNYQKAPFFKQYLPFFQEIYEREWQWLCDLNEVCIRRLLEELRIKVKVIRASSLFPQGSKGSLLLDICKKVGASMYLSGISGKEYLDESIFRDAGIKLRYQQFHHPIYKQLFEPFIPCLSVIDLLFNYGDHSLDIIQGIGVPAMEELFQ